MSERTPAEATGTAHPAVAARQAGSRCCLPETAVRVDRQGAAELSGVLKALAHPLRIRILDLLLANEGSVCVCDLVASLPVSQPTVSHHLQILRDAGLVDCSHRGVWAHYFANHGRLEDVAADMGRFLRRGAHHDEPA